MRRRFSAGLAAALIATSAAAAPLDAERDCRVIDLTDSDRKAQISGVEDVVFDATRDAFLLSAFDRDRIEEPEANDGGLYFLPRESAAAETRIALSRLRLSGDIDIRPHGVDISADGARIVAIDRHPWRGADNRSTVLDLTSDGDRWSAAPLADGAMACRANDVAILADGAVAVSRDRGACGGLAKTWEDVFATSGASIVILRAAEAPAIVAEDLNFANGLAAATAEDGRTRLVYAQTRSSVIATQLYPGKDGEAPTLFHLNGAPDNINRLSVGGLVAAHDSLFRLAMHRAFPGWLSPPGGQIYHFADFSSFPGQVYSGEFFPEIPPLLRIPGDLFAGPTSAAAGGGLLLVGSATAAGVLACDWNGSKEDS